MREEALLPETDIKLPEDFFETVGKRVSGLRKKAGYTQEELSNVSGVARSTVSRVERGYVTNVDVYMLLAEGLKVTLDYLMWGQKELDLESKITELIEQLILLRNQIRKMGD